MRDHPTTPINELHRRDFLRLTAGAGAALALSAQATAHQSDPQKQHAARNVILMVADGMSLGSFSLANTVSERQSNQPLHWTNWINSGARLSLNATTPADRLVTDSAAAASCWSTGVRTNNEVLCTSPEGKALIPLGHRVKRAGKTVGIVSNSTLTDATPAAFLASAQNRADSEHIAKQIAQAAPDVLLGGGARHLTTPITNTNTPFLTTKQALHNANTMGAPLVGLFAQSRMSYEIERPDTEPSLLDMTNAALSHLSHAPNGFFLMVEGALVDVAAHANDAASIVHEMLMFDKAVKQAIDFASSRDDTLLIVTSDHSNANPGFFARGTDCEDKMNALLAVKHSFAWIADQLRSTTKQSRTPDTWIGIIKEATNITITNTEAERLQAWTQGEQVDLAQKRNTQLAPLGSVLSNYLGVAFTGPNHTLDHVLTASSGPGSALLPTIGHHEHVHHAITSSLNLT